MDLNLRNFREKEIVKGIIIVKNSVMMYMLILVMMMMMSSSRVVVSGTKKTETYHSHSLSKFEHTHTDDDRISFEGGTNINRR